MSQEQVFEELSVSDVRRKAEELKSQGYRMVQICGIPQEGRTELVYSFDLDHGMVNLKVTVPFGTAVDSITSVWWAAFVYENEIHDLFGVEFADSKLDYKGNFFRTGTKTPWKGPEKKAEAQRWARERRYRSDPSTPLCRSPCTWTWSWRARPWSAPSRPSGSCTGGWRSWWSSATTSR